VFFLGVLLRTIEQLRVRLRANHYGVNDRWSIPTVLTHKYQTSLKKLAETNALAYFAYSLVREATNFSCHWHQAAMSWNPLLGLWHSVQISWSVCPLKFFPGLSKKILGRPTRKVSYTLRMDWLCPYSQISLKLTSDEHPSLFCPDVSNDDLLS
jgi:hypothetical protein